MSRTTETGIRVENSPQDADEYAKTYLRDNDVWENSCVDHPDWQTGQDAGIFVNDARHVDVLYNDLNGGQINGTGTTYGHNCESDGTANDIKLGGNVLDGEGEVAEFDGLRYKYDTAVENSLPVIDPPDCDPIPDIQVYCRGNT